jgi:hypothetical protein
MRLNIKSNRRVKAAEIEVQNTKVLSDKNVVSKMNWL